MLKKNKFEFKLRTKIIIHSERIIKKERLSNFNFVLQFS